MTTLVRPLALAAFGAGLLAAAFACGGSTTAPTSPGTGAGGSGSGGSTSAATITITSSGVNPSRVTVPPGSQVLFINNDRVSHQMFSDPHPEHTDCPAINQVGFLDVGQSRQTGNLTVVRTCGYHDHNQPDNASLKGSIVIQ